jgi:hypothetical protein
METGFYAAAPFGVTPEITKLIMDLGQKAAPPQKSKPGRPGLTAAAEQAVAAGQFPPPITIGSATNPGYQKRAARLYALAFAGDLETLEATQITGTNSYSKALAKYREILITTLKGGVK